MCSLTEYAVSIEHMHHHNHSFLCPVVIWGIIIIITKITIMTIIMMTTKQHIIGKMQQEIARLHSSKDLVVYRMCSLAIECVLLLERKMQQEIARLHSSKDLVVYRMCSLAIECVLLLERKMPCRCVPHRGFL